VQREKNNIFAGIDLWLVLFFILLVFLGWLNIYAASTSEEHYEILDFKSRYGKQLIWIGLSIPIIIVVLFIETRFYERFASIFYIVAILSLIGLFIFGKNINGARSWYAVGSFTIQPTEFAKAFTALAIAKLLSDKAFTFKPFKNHIKSFFIILLPAFLITLQPDPGSALVYFAFFFVFYREGLPIYYFTIGGLSILIFLLTLKLGIIGIIPWMIYITIGIFVIIFGYLSIYKSNILKKIWLQLLITLVIISGYIFSINYIFNNIFQQRHRDRFNIILGKTTDTQGIGYNTNQAIQTIASGGITGKGYLEGDRTQGKFVPEQDTDYIFSTVGEEWGFIGSIVVITLFVALMLRIIHIAERQKSTFSRVYGYSIAAIFFFHFMVNIGMVIGLVPTIGIPLPFFSYGGSSLWGFIGSIVVFALFIALMLRIIHIAERQKSTFSRVYGYSIAAIFFFHFMVNIGMVIGLVPTIGIPLPFFSYGGSSLWGFTLLLFIFIRLDANRSYEW
jgi:rod shape determining protein RodA